MARPRPKTISVIPPAPRPNRTTDMKWRKTLLKEVVYEHYRAKVAQHFDKIVEAQIDSACGQLQWCYTDKTGRFKIIETVEELERLQAEGKTCIRVATRLANVSAQTDIFNRMMGKAAEPRAQIEISGQIDLVASRLIAARKRLAAHKPPAPSPVPAVIDVPVKRAVTAHVKAHRAAHDAADADAQARAQAEVEDTPPRVK